MDDERDRTFVESLSREERVLVLLRDELYEGSWDDLELDLRARKERKPSIVKLNTRIEEDLDRIARLRGYERDRGVNLGELLARQSSPGEGSAS